MKVQIAKQRQSECLSDEPTILGSCGEEVGKLSSI